MSVWIAQYRDDFDYTMANEYGPLQIITYREVPRSFCGPEWDGFAEDIRKFMKEYEGENDYILFSGNPQQMIVIAAVMAENHTQIRILKWMKRERRYVPLHVPLCL